MMLLSGMFVNERFIFLLQKRSYLMFLSYWQRKYPRSSELLCSSTQQQAEGQKSCVLTTAAGSSSLIQVELR
jgi:hypothetical protein